MNYTKEHKKLLFDQLQEDNELAFKAIYVYFYKRLVIYILNYTKDAQLAQDMSQEALITLWEKRKTLKSSDSLSAFLYRIAYNKFIDQERKKRVANMVLENIRHEALTEITEHEDLFEDRINLVKDAIALLPPKCKEIFRMHKEQGKSYKEIASTLDISAKTVENQIGKGLKLIREKMAAHINLFYCVMLKRSQHLFTSK